MHAYEGMGKGGEAVTLLTFFLLAGVGVPLLIHVLSHKLGQRIVTVRSELNVQLVDGIELAGEAWHT